MIELNTFSKNEEKLHQISDYLEQLKHALVEISADYGEEQEDYERFQTQFFEDSSLQTVKGYDRRVALPDRYVYDASPMAVYGIQAMANGAYGRMLFQRGPEPLLKGY